MFQDYQSSHIKILLKSSHKIKGQYRTERKKSSLHRDLIICYKSRLNKMLQFQKCLTA